MAYDGVSQTRSPPNPRTIIVERGSSGAGWIVAALLTAALFVGIYVLAGMTRGSNLAHAETAVATDRDATSGPGPTQARESGQGS